MPCIADTGRALWRAAARTAAFGIIALLGCAAHAQPPDADTDLPEGIPDVALPDVALPDVAQPDVEETLPTTPPEVAEQTVPQRDLVNRVEAQIEFNALVSDQRFADALVVGEQLLQLTEEELGPRSRETAAAHAALASVQREVGEHDDSELNYLRAIELYRDIEGPYAESLIDPMIGLGDNYHAARQYVNAVSAYNEARTVNRRVYGLLNERQIPILDRMTESFQHMNRLAEAAEQQVAALELAQRNYAEGSPRHLEAIYKYAGWLRDVGRFREEREQYAHAMRLIRDAEGRESPAMVRPLRETANSFRTQRIGDSQGAGALNRALDIMQDQREPDPLALAELMRDFGDWQIAFGRPGSADDGHAQYRQAWQLLGQVTDGERLRREWFTGLDFVLREPVSQRGLSYEPDASPGYVVVQFDIDEKGHTSDVRVAVSDPPGFKDEDVARAVGRSRFRPHMAEGEVVPGGRLALRFNYRYLPDETG